MHIRPSRNGVLERHVILALPLPASIQSRHRAAIDAASAVASASLESYWPRLPPSKNVARIFVYISPYQTNERIRLLTTREPGEMQLSVFSDPRITTGLDDAALRQWFTNLFLSAIRLLLEKHSLDISFDIPAQPPMDPRRLASSESKAILELSDKYERHMRESETAAGACRWLYDSSRLINFAIIETRDRHSQIIKGILGTPATTETDRHRSKTAARLFADEREAQLVRRGLNPIERSTFVPLRVSWKLDCELSAALATRNEFVTDLSNNLKSSGLGEWAEGSVSPDCIQAEFDIAPISRAEQLASEMIARLARVHSIAIDAP